jgi:hypothetical protein
MSTTDPSALPNVAEILAPLLARVSRDHQPLLLAIAERMAAERYRRWASRVTIPQQEVDLLACAVREEEIASRIEGLYPDASAIVRDILSNNPDLQEINHGIFDGRPLEEQFTIQAQGERLGAATWRAFAQTASDASTRVFLACAELEEASALVLETLIEAARV